MKGDTLSGWGNLPVPGSERRSENLEEITKDAVLTRGLGRSYGDSSLPPPGVTEVASCVLADRILSFDADSGLLRAEAGLSLQTLNRLFLARGFFTPVSPGTQFVTLGGMVASDVHGKNHHVEGCFGAHVKALKLRVASGRMVECSRTVEKELFWATVGGMGLTGHILEVEFALRKIPTPWIYQESERVPNIDPFIAKLKRDAKGWPFTMGWIDCLSGGTKLGRGILYRGRWAEPHEAPSKIPSPKRRLTVPFMLPTVCLNPLTVRAFNAAYYWKHLRPAARGIVHPETFFYPLDVLLHWNRIYGRRGFTQYQCVLPDAAGPQAVRAFLERLTRRGGASFLCVIKDCGDEGDGILSFPMRGTSIALDIPVRNDTQGLINELNAFVISQGGRIYLTKDAFTRGEDFRQMEPRLSRFLEIRKRWDPEGKIRSAQSVRMMGDAP